MHVVRGTVAETDRDRQVTRQLVDIVESTATPAIRVWMPPKQIAFGRRDTTADGYERASEIAHEYGYDAIEREVGGSAVAYTGDTVAFAYGVPIETGRESIDCRYQEVESLLARSLETAGATVARGEPDASFCPGEHSLQGDGKIAGIAQRVRRESALVGGYVIVRQSDEHAVSNVLEPIYAALEMPFDPQSVGCVESVGGPNDVDTVVKTIEETFLDDSDPIITSAAKLAVTDVPSK